MPKLLREPLLHFVLIAAALFAIYEWMNPGEPTESQNEIVLTEDDLLQMKLPLLAQGYSDLTPQQIRNLIEVRVYEEVLYREAMQMGLDQDDTIVRRRLAQKMEFLAEDLSALREPAPGELREWFESHPDDFAYPPRISFHHIFFPFDEFGSSAHDAAKVAYSGIRNIDDPDAGGEPNRSDTLMLQDTYADRLPGHIANDFGSGFANDVFELAPGEWSRPVESGYGWHLVFVDRLMQGRIPEYEEVEAEVQAQWTAHQRKVFRDEAYRVLREKYVVVLPPGVDIDMQASTVDDQAGN